MTSTDNGWTDVYVQKFGFPVCRITAENSGVYGDDAQVYVFGGDILKFDITKNSLIQKDTIDTIDSEYLTSIEVKNKGVSTFKAEVVPRRRKNRCVYKLDYFEAI